ncbi:MULTISPECIES: thioesterase family protein [unclassified Microcella]|uniref:acyl-CoA thioesterase n=1 Tax=unclassified Microcella TaxID=2630066 RepID=UPI0006FF8595|nr:MULTISPECIES: thioesterase family protein [unclassified Microcella]KQV24668.1 4-hydroxybenzoyl-CoA thioesterase [Yonghaparkia sp. Root332]KRF30958.1 4-hydroxybenzoyl-CoA thioesterase [Yonghaparkia sp. Soil809]
MTRIHVPISLRWSDLDAYGHVNNARMLTLLEEARIEVFWRGRGETATPLPELHIDEGAQSLIARQEVEYLAPIPHLRDPLDIQLWIGALGGASLDICYEVRSPEGAEPQVVFARALSTLVLVDEGSGRPRRISDRERALWSPYIEETVAFRRRS